MVTIYTHRSSFFYAIQLFFANDVVEKFSLKQKQKCGNKIQKRDRRRRIYLFHTLSYPYVLQIKN